MRSLGVDVGVRKGLDLLLLGGDRRVLATERRHPVERLASTVRELEPDVVAIDAPPAWGASGHSRRTERELHRLGIRCFDTPSDPARAEHPFYTWMAVGFRAFESISSPFPRYAGGGSVSGRAIEVFPHASAVVLAGHLPPRGTSLHAWRRGVLGEQGVDGSVLRSADLVDAALAALTGAFALEGRFTATGDPVEGQIVLPIFALPDRPYARPQDGRPARVPPRVEVPVG
jgi:predicted nuclease with RNAse H fold